MANRLTGEVITNKSARGDKGTMIAMIKGTKSEVVLHYLNLLPRSLKLGVREITIDLSPSMKIIAKRAFPNATIVSDRFHVQKLMNEAISDLRVDYRWQTIDRENVEIQLAKEVKMTKGNLINRAIEYIPRKTKEGRPLTVRVPLNAIAQEIVAQHKNCEGDKLFPFISEQKYNVAIKRIFKAKDMPPKH